MFSWFWIFFLVNCSAEQEIIFENCGSYWFTYSGDYCISSGDQAVSGTYKFDDESSSKTKPVWYNSNQNKYLTMEMTSCSPGPRRQGFAGFDLTIDDIEYCRFRWKRGSRFDNNNDRRCFDNGYSNWHFNSGNVRDDEFIIDQCEKTELDDAYRNQDICISNADLSIDSSSITGAYHVVEGLSVTVTAPAYQLQGPIYTTGENSYIYFIASSNVYYVIIDTDINYTNGGIASCQIAQPPHIFSFHVDSEVFSVTECDLGQWRVFVDSTTMGYDDSLVPYSCDDIYTGEVCLSYSSNYLVEGIYEYDKDLTGPWTGPVYVNKDVTPTKYLYRFETVDNYGWTVDNDLSWSYWVYNTSWSDCWSVEKNDVPDAYLSDITHCLKGDWKTRSWDGNAYTWSWDDDMRAIKCGTGYSKVVYYFDNIKNKTITLVASIAFLILLTLILCITCIRMRKRGKNQYRAVMKNEEIENVDF